MWRLCLSVKAELEGDAFLRPSGHMDREKGGGTSHSNVQFAEEGGAGKTTFDFNSRVVNVFE